ncbi:hypothetical protein C8R45DRAFT_1216508 [Mycena sanguinolenta]|nr:hypothetical protein C8R45DRAFT_1216508 [Mycena sanguinolenta]
MQQQIRDLEAQVGQCSQTRSAPSVPDESVNRPKNASKTTMRTIQKELGYDKVRWNAFRSYCRDATTSARLDWDGNWKSQRSEKLSMAYNAIEEAFPETRRFQGQWAIDRTVKQYWNNRKNYRSCVDKPTTYRGKQALARRAQHTESPDASVRSPRPSSPPMAGPSRPPPCPLNNTRPPSDSEEDGDNFVPLSDPDAPRSDEDDDQGEEEGEEEEKERSANPKGKRGASGTGRRVKRARPD